ncbi:MAG TPA: bifunctional 3,4-dihydroxy-2-butanone-4-phosphate synthase/GTP cyclohydrolase II, partial [Gallionellaceae bacterium]|nr:bifunctional 3,4-dihydroxy-2-butanone-4-phosphate synthase/GTP cyclohydrolase II [Gallionellaceae bacterium]
RISQSSAGVLVLMHHNETSQELLTRAAAKPEAQHAAQWDPRSYGIGAQILRDLNVGKMCLIATPRKLPSMVGFGLEIVGYCQAKE